MVCKQLPRVWVPKCVLSVRQTVAINTQKGPALWAGPLVCGVFLPSVPQSACSARSRYEAMLAVHLFASTICPWAKMVFLGNW